MKRIETNNINLRVNLEEVLNEIETDLLNNQSELAYRTDYYTKKYRGDLLNDVFVGLTIGEFYMYKMIVYINNGQSKVRSEYTLNRKLTEIINITTTYIPMVKIFNVPTFGTDSIDKALDTQIKEFLTKNPNLRVIHKPTLSEIRGIYPNRDNTTSIQVDFR